ncbi:MAG: class I SAM-dependent methyltransferase [Thermoanaerobaculia bacterium]
MDKSYEEIYAVVEERHPWFVARRRLFAALAGDDRRARVLDVGCGTGIFLVHLEALGFEHLAGVETSADLRAKARDPSIEMLPEIPERRDDGVFSYDKVFMLDVLEHIDDDRGTLDRIHGLLEPGGRFYLSVPAHPFLWSRHDDINQHRRRYRKAELGEKLRAAGFIIRKLSYWNSLAFPAICLARWLKLGESSSDFAIGNPAAWWLYGAVLRFENWWVQRMPLPIGVSLIAVAEKADA